MSRYTHTDGYFGTYNDNTIMFPIHTRPVKYDRFNKIHSDINCTFPRLSRILKAAGKQKRKYNKPSI